MSRTIGVLVMAYGTPRQAEEIEAFYTHVRHGSPAPVVLLANLRRRYRAIGGTSPLASITYAQGTQLVHRLNLRRPDMRFKTYIGYKHAAPFIEDAVAAMHADGITRAVTLVLAPHFSAVSIQAYNDRAMASARYLGGPELTTTSSWYRQPGFTRSWVSRILATLASIAASETPRTLVIFSAHSLPCKTMETGDPYVRQVDESARLIATAAHIEHYTVAWQSAGRTTDLWIGPDVRDVTRERWKIGGYRTFVYCPIGFVADHLEVLYDNDVECRAVTDELGAAYLRPAMPNTDPLFIDCLCDVVMDQLALPALVTS